MVKNDVIRFYLLMLVAHMAHVLEEIWGRFWLINVLGLGWFLVINVALFGLPVLFFYFVLQEKHWAYAMSLIYAGIMILNGAGHNLLTLWTGRYFNAYAGGFTGIVLILIGLPLIYALRQEMPRARELSGDGPPAQRARS